MARHAPRTQRANRPPSPRHRASRAGLAARPSATPAPPDAARLLGGPDADRILTSLGEDGVAQLQRSSGNAAVGTLVARASKRSTYPWIGRIDGTWAASLRRTPEKRSDDPHRNTLADLPRGSEVRVTSAKGGWLRVEVDVGGRIREGYVSQELVRYVRADAFELAPIEVKVHVPTVAEAFVALKRAESRILQAGRHPTDEEREDLELAAGVLEQTGTYVVDQRTWTVDFKRSPGSKTQVHSIEDFILFVESVERAYPWNKPTEIASEIRETWYADPNWAVLLASQGIRDVRSGKLQDIETKGPIFEDFDMKQIAPNKKGSPVKGLKLDTPMGRVDLSHVMAGIDATLAGGMAASYPESYLEDREKQTGTSDYDTFANTAKYDLTKEASGGGDTRDFATWAGDLGQVYAEFIVDRYLKKDKKATLAAWTADKMPPEQLLGDIHGYVAIPVYKSVPASDSPTGREVKVSNILRDMYLVPKSATATLQDRFLTASGKSAAELPDYIEDRTLRFARLWFAKRVYEVTGMSPTFPRTEIRDVGEKFMGIHAVHKRLGKADDQLKVLVDRLLKELRSPVR